MKPPTLKNLTEARHALSTKEKGFLVELEGLLNRYSKESASDTPDFILANYLLWCLEAFNVTMAYRKEWYALPGAPKAPATKPKRKRAK